MDQQINDTNIKLVELKTNKMALIENSDFNRDIILRSIKNTDDIPLEENENILAETKNKIDVLAPQWTLGVLDRMNEVETSICSPFDHGEFKFCKRVEFGRSMESRSYDQAIILTNSLKSALIPYFSKIPKRTGWLGEMRYGLINDIRKFDRTKDTLMIEKFAVLADDISNKNIK